METHDLQGALKCHRIQSFPDTLLDSLYGFRRSRNVFLGRCLLLPLQRLTCVRCTEDGWTLGFQLPGIYIKSRSSLPELI